MKSIHKMKLEGFIMLSLTLLFSCSPKVSPRLLELYKEYHDKGFEIYQPLSDLLNEKLSKK